VDPRHLRAARRPRGRRCRRIRGCRFAPEHLDESFDHEFVDFYVAPKARGRGLGRFAVDHLLAERPGSWILFTLAGNAGAQAFWRRALAAPSIVDLEERDRSTEFRFRVDRPSG
jgi:predicted acetyltransferase